MLDDLRLLLAGLGSPGCENTASRARRTGIALLCGSSPSKGPTSNTSAEQPLDNQRILWVKQGAPAPKREAASSNQLDGGRDY